VPKKVVKKATVATKVVKPEAKQFGFVKDAKIAKEKAAEAKKAEKNKIICGVFHKQEVAY